MAKTIAIVNQKGGVGKTTTCVNLAAALKNQGCRVLVCDFDPQANTTSGFGVDKTTSPNIYDVLLNGTETAKAISSTSYGDVLPSNKALAGATIEMIALEQREYRLKNALEQVAEHYDYIFIDCPPSLELLTLNALCAADTVLVPVQCEYYALEGLSDLLSTIRIVKRSLNPKIALEGVVLTMYDGRTNLSMPSPRWNRGSSSLESGLTRKAFRIWPTPSASTGSFNPSPSAGSRRATTRSSPGSAAGGPPSWRA